MTIPLAELRKDRSKYDKGRKRSGKRTRSGPSGKKDTNMVRPILAIDGEGITDQDGRHRYVMLAASSGDYIWGHELSTRDCFDFLLSLPKGHLVVGFSIGYDVAKWIGSMPKKTLKYLWENGRANWGEYSIRYAPTKYITIRRGKETVHIYDVFGYYQKSFVASLEEWKVGNSEQIARIRDMKASRGSFSNEGMDEMLAYCLEECELLVLLVEKLRIALIEGGIPMRQWYGAGAIASAIMEKENVKRYLLRTPPEKYSLPILSAYFGGRFELFESGEHRGVYLYDIRSAYPHIASTLPCQTHLVYEEYDGWRETPFGLHLCEWELDPRTPWPPFPFRDQRTRQILYPYKGRGWYHASEVQAALRFYPGVIRVHKSLVFAEHCPSDCPGQPFAFIPSYFAYRAKLKKRGSQAQLTVKLGLNSLYGKTAQGVGYGEKKPPFQSYLYAGAITAGTRAMLLDAITQSPEDIIWTATDGIASKKRLNLNIGEALGEWEETHADWVFCVQPGVYQVSKDGKVEIRSRGFGKAETNFQAIRAAYDRDPIWGEFLYETTRFVGLGGALSRTDFWGHFGRWLKMTRRVTFFPSKRYPELVLDGAERGLTIQDMMNMTAKPPIRMWPSAGVSGQEESAPYQPKTSWIDQWDRESGNDDALDILVDSEQP